jgi:hypothetical protein
VLEICLHNNQCSKIKMHKGFVFAGNKIKKEDKMVGICDTNSPVIPPYEYNLTDRILNLVSAQK